MSSTSRAPVGTVVSAHFASLGLSPPASEEIDLRDAGLNSLQVVDLILLLETELDIEIPQSAVRPDNFRSVATITRMVGEILGCDAGGTGG